MEAAELDAWLSTSAGAVTYSELPLTEEQEQAVAVLAAKNIAHALDSIAERVAALAVDIEDDLQDFGVFEGAVLDGMAALPDEVLAAITEFGDLTWEEAHAIGDFAAPDTRLGAVLYWCVRAMSED